jgi:hypothetical protein
MARTSTKKVLSTVEPKKTSNTINLNYVFLFILDAIVLFSYRIPMNFWRWLTTMVVRGYIFYIYSFYHEDLLKFIAPSPNFGFFDIIHNIIGIGICLFCLWYFFTTLMLFMVAFTYKFGYATNSYYGESFDEIERFKDWRDNKMKFSSYQEATQLMRDSSILNNLDSNDPEARKVLGYINNQMRFMGYKESLEFLRGHK